MPVNFSELNDTYFIKDRYTHLIHYYPAKLLCAIPEFFIEAFTKEGDTVLDPFSGSGTVALQTFLAGRRALAAEINPLARLITRVKTTPIAPEILQREWTSLRARIDRRRSAVGGLPGTLRFWHSPPVLKQMSAIGRSLSEWVPTCERDLRGQVREFFLLMFSSIVRRVSLADPRIAPPVRVKPRNFKPGSVHRRRALALLRSKQNADCLSAFETAVENGIRRLSTISGMPYQPCEFVSHDAKKLPDDLSARLILTSPPYLAAQKYTRTTSLEMYWLGYLANSEARATLERDVIGSEQPKLTRGQPCPDLGFKDVDVLVRSLWSTNRTRAAITHNYFADMFKVLGVLGRTLAENGRLVVVVGNNTVCGQPVSVHNIFERWCAARLGLRTEAILVDPIRKYGLLTKRHHTAGIIENEYILVMRRKAN